MADCFVGVDAGGTRAEAVLVDAAGRELARGRAPGAVASPGAVEPAAEAVARAVEDALGTVAGTGPVEGLWAGVAGAGEEEVRIALEKALAGRSLARRARVGTDVDAAFESAFGDAPGLLVIAGTGSVAVARDGTGRLRRAGGWGARLGDEGSGYWIAMQALGAVARAEDGRAQPTALRGAVLDHLDLGEPRALVGWVDRATKGQVAALAPRVLEVAAAGDPVAASIATDAAAALRTHVIALLDDFDAGEGGASPTLALSGGLIAEGGPLRPTLERILTPLGLPLYDGPLDPALGAARLAARL